MTKDDVLRLALEYVELVPDDRYNAEHIDQDALITAIKAALEVKDETVAVAWAEGYQMGIADERTSEANIGIAGFNAKVEPARENPYVTTLPQRTWIGLTKEEFIYFSSCCHFEVVDEIEKLLQRKNT